MMEKIQPEALPEKRGRLSLTEKAYKLGRGKKRGLHYTSLATYRATVYRLFRRQGRELALNKANNGRSADMLFKGREGIFIIGKQWSGDA